MINKVICDIEEFVQKKTSSIVANSFIFTWCINDLISDLYQNRIENMTDDTIEFNLEIKFFLDS